jgi:hypothetical protein
MIAARTLTAQQTLASQQTIAAQQATAAQQTIATQTLKAQTFKARTAQTLIAQTTEAQTFALSLRPATRSRMGMGMNPTWSLTPIETRRQSQGSRLPKQEKEAKSA